MNAPILPEDEVPYSLLLDLYHQLFEHSDVEELSLSEDEDMELSVSEEEGSVSVEESLSGDEDMKSASEDSLQPEDEEMVSEGDDLSSEEDEDMLVSSEEEDDDLPDFYLIPSFEPEPSKTPNDTRRFIRVIAHDAPNQPARHTYKRIDSAQFVDMIGRGRIFLCVRRDLLRAECPEIDRWENIAEIWAELLDEPFVDGDGSSTDPYVIYD
ncbi:hypothetical protein B0H13DRAFT_1897689 [Mycena leptocephala]|nr:hypothetical protein B0H13DRAFT_1897689 [Mycena leptocephala]